MKLNNKLVLFTENILTKYERRQFIKKKSHKEINPILDWLGSFLWAAGVVLLLNQFLFQAYVIPSKSMENTLLVQDRLFVNKFIYGPELLPGLFKLPSNNKPQKSEIIIFENPEYRSRGSLFDLIQRLVFMLSLSMIDLDKDELGNPAHHFLIKRVIASDGEIVQFRKGEPFIKPIGESSFLNEFDYKKINNLNYDTIRNIEPEHYRELDSDIKRNIYSQNDHEAIGYYEDRFYSVLTYNRYLSHQSPSKVEYYQDFIKSSIGQYVPSNWYLPLGDNRDNSKDGRYFGPIHSSEVLGRADLRFWPFKRFGGI